MIKFENVNVTMQGKRILSDINLEIQDGEFVLICQRRWNDYGLREKCCRDAYV